MKKALIIYRSRSGTTKQYAENIGEFLKGEGLEATVAPTGSYSQEQLAGADYLLLGCWTNGLFFFLQHPDKTWNTFAKAMPAQTQAKTALFATYKLLTGSMFAKMRAALQGKVKNPAVELKSKNGKLTDENKQALKQFVTG